MGWCIRRQAPFVVDIHFSSNIVRLQTVQFALLVKVPACETGLYGNRHRKLSADALLVIIYLQHSAETFSLLSLLPVSS